MSLKKDGQEVVNCSTNGCNAKGLKKLPKIV